MKTLFTKLLAGLLILCAPGTNAQSVVTVGGGATITCPATPTSTWTAPPAGLTFSSWSRGTGVTCASSSAALSGSGFNTASAAAGISANKYYTVTITTDAAHSFTLTSLTWLTAVSSGSASFAVSYSNNGGTVTSFGGVGSSTTTNTFTGSVAVAAGTSLVLYLVPSNTGAAGTTVRWSNGSTITLTTAAAGASAPSLAAASTATVDAPFDVTFADDPAWRAAITGITVGGVALTAGFSVSPGRITYTPSGSVPASLLQSSGSKALSVQASGYLSSAVVQTIETGLPTLESILVQPVGPAATGGPFATQPSVRVEDRYGNYVPGVMVTAAVTPGQQASWALGGATTAVTNASGVAAFATLTATNAGSSPLTGATLTCTPSTGAGTSTSGTFTIPGSAPVLTPVAGATVDTLFDLTFADDSAWRAAITSVTVGGITLAPGAYDRTNPGLLRFTPSASALLQSSGTKSIVVMSANYGPASASQQLGSGAANKLAMVTQPASPAVNGAVLATQPVVAIVDQYGNATSTAAFVTAAVGAGLWTLSGTTSVTSVGGTASFADLAATSVASIGSAAIAFSASGLTGCSSGTFTIPAPAFLTLSSLGVVTTQDFNTIGTSATATLSLGFRIGSSSTSTDFALLQSATSLAAGTTGAGAVNSVSAGGAYNFADGTTASSTDRSIGFVPTGGFGTPRSIVVKIRNSTGSTITDLLVTFDYEKVRSGINTVSWTFFHGSAGSPAIAASAGDLSSAADGSVAAINPALTISRSVAINNLNIASGADYYLRWTMSGSSNSSSQAWGIDNISLKATSTATYTWSGGTAGDYGSAANWTPARTTPAATDILCFTSGTVAVSNTTNNQHIGRLNVSGGAQVILSGGGSMLLVDGNASFSINVAAGASLTLSGIDVGLNEDALVDGVLASDHGIDISTAGKTMTINGTFDAGTSGYLSNLNGGGNFILNSGATIRTGNAAGIRGPGLSPNTGAILVGGSRVFSSSANYVLGGMVTSPGFSNIALTNAGVITGTLTISNNGTTVALDRSLSIATLALASGTISTNGNTLTVSSLTRTGGTINASSGTLSFTNGNPLVLPSGALATAIGNLAITGTGQVTTADAHTVSGDLMIGTGGLSLGADVSIGGNLARGSSATFTHNQHKLTLNGGSAQVITCTGGGTITVYDLDVANSAGASLATGTSLVVDGTLALTSGVFAVGNNNLTLNGSAISGTPGNLSVSSTADLSFTGASTFDIPPSVTQVRNLAVGGSSTVTADASLVVTGTMSVSGLFKPSASAVVSGAGTLSGSGIIAVTRATGTDDLAGQYTIGAALTGMTIAMSGAAAQGLGAGSFASLIINNTGGDVTLGGAVILSGALVLSAGHLLLNGSPLTLGSITGGSASAFVVTDAASSIVRKALNGLQTFPIGVSTGSYTPVSIDNAAGRDWSVAVLPGIVPASGSFHFDKALLRTWNLEPSAVAGATNLAFSFNATDPGIGAAGFNAANSLTANHYNAGGHWEIAGLPQSPTPVGMVFTVVVTGQTSFSPFAISESNGALPLTLLSFTGRRTVTGSELLWRATSDNGCRGFDVQRSTDGARYDHVALVPGLLGTAEHHYSYVDTNAAGTSWYRLTILGADGATAVSPVLRIGSEPVEGVVLTGIYPNPAAAAGTDVLLQAPVQTVLSILVLDAMGQMVRFQKARVKAGISLVHLNLAGMPPGHYSVRAVAANGMASNALMLILK